MTCLISRILRFFLLAIIQKSALAFVPCSSFVSIRSACSTITIANKLVSPENRILSDSLMGRKFAYGHGGRIRKSLTTNKPKLQIGVTGVSRMNLFGLGFGEIALILIGVGIVLGPSGLAKVAKESAAKAIEMKDEIQTIPAEFQKGVELGEIEARSRKAKRVIVGPGSPTKDDTTMKDDA